MFIPQALAGHTAGLTQGKTTVQPLQTPAPSSDLAAGKLGVKLPPGEGPVGPLQLRLIFDLPLAQRSRAFSVPLYRVSFGKSPPSPFGGQRVRKTLVKVLPPSFALSAVCPRSVPGLKELCQRTNEFMQGTAEREQPERSQDTERQTPHRHRTSLPPSLVASLASRPTWKSGGLQAEPPAGKTGTPGEPQIPTPHGREAARAKKDVNSERVFSWADRVRDRLQGRPRAAQRRRHGHVDKTPRLVNESHPTCSASYSEGKHFIIILNHFL